MPPLTILLLSPFLLHRYREWGWQIFQAFEKYTRVDSGGYTSLDDVTSLPPITYYTWIQEIVGIFRIFGELMNLLKFENNKTKQVPKAIKHPVIL